MLCAHRSHRLALRYHWELIPGVASPAWWARANTLRDMAAFTSAFCGKRQDGCFSWSEPKGRIVYIFQKKWGMCILYIYIYIDRVREFFFMFVHLYGYTDMWHVPHVHPPPWRPGYDHYSEGIVYSQYDNNNVIREIPEESKGGWCGCEWLWMDAKGNQSSWPKS